MQMPYDIFLSHSWDGATHERVLRIARTLQRCGIRVWVDADHIFPGRNALGQMASGIVQSEYFGVFVSETYIKKVNEQNNNVSREFTLATCAKKPLLCVLLDARMRHVSDRPPGVFTMVLGDIVYIDGCKSSDDEIAACITTNIRRRRRQMFRSLSKKTRFVEVPTVIHL
jgi:hypothetical protein